MRTRSQAAAERHRQQHQQQQEGSGPSRDEARAATALLKQKKAKAAAAAVVAVKATDSSLALAAAPGAPLQSPWGTKTLSKAARKPGKKKPAALPAAEERPRALFPYPHTPAKAKPSLSAAAATKTPASARAKANTKAEDAAVVGEVTRELSNTAFAKRYAKPAFGPYAARTHNVVGGATATIEVRACVFNTSIKSINCPWFHVRD